MSKPIWITVCDQETKEVVFEGNQLHWADVYFSDASYEAIEDALNNSRFFAGTLSTMREMSDDEIAQYPGLLEFNASFE